MGRAPSSSTHRALNLRSSLSPANSPMAQSRRLAANPPSNLSTWVRRSTSISILEITAQSPSPPAYLQWIAWFAKIQSAKAAGVIKLSAKTPYRTDGRIACGGGGGGGWCEAKAEQSGREGGSLPGNCETHYHSGRAKVRPDLQDDESLIAVLPPYRRASGFREMQRVARSKRESRRADLFPDKGEAP